MYTFQQDAVGSSHQGPRVRCPVGVIETASEREEAAEQLRELPHQQERAKRDEKYEDDGVCERDESHGLEHTRRRKTEGAQKVYEVGRLVMIGLVSHSSRMAMGPQRLTHSEIHIDMLEVQ